jgi:hypothetical protein
MSSDAPTPMMPNAPNAVARSAGRWNDSPLASCAPVTAYGVNCRKPTAIKVDSVNAPTMSIDAVSTSR